jgi:hypothetical protein
MYSLERRIERRIKELLRTLLEPIAPGFDRLDLAVPFLIDLAPLLTH